MAASFRLQGTQQVRQRLTALARRMPQAVERALRDEAEIEMTEAKRRTPVDTGALRSSGHVEPVERTGREISVRLSFGGVAAPYGLYVHEDLEAFHKVGQAKFLESVIFESAPFMPQRLARRLEQELR